MARFVKLKDSDLYGTILEYNGREYSREGFYDGYVVLNNLRYPNNIHPEYAKQSDLLTIKLEDNDGKHYLVPPRYYKLYKYYVINNIQPKFEINSYGLKSSPPSIDLELPFDYSRGSLVYYVSHGQPKEGFPDDKKYKIISIDTEKWTATLGDVEDRRKYMYGIPLQDVLSDRMMRIKKMKEMI